ncbi:DUF1806 family protein [Geomicrobium sp. JCM 19038]|uniref:DUF1806 family protein n=1 Tax=Geomicrobium sp. JCM 19038 TaxID=1460635 RepID=UPI00045F300D|nr:DUF1806 family protein [Geomicrobium sp. JCM 19038]GAK09239.1 hypothetical protein JCM19038_3066 [Geomicrobium sp. JCM 19038]
MIEINKDELQENLSQYFNHEIYVHFEMTNGAYAAYRMVKQLLALFEMQKQS